MQAGEGAERVAGLFINTLPVRLVIGEEGVEAGVRRTHALLAELLDHEHASLALAQRCSAVPAPTPLFSALLNYRYSQGNATTSWPEALQACEGIQVLGDEARSNYPLTLSVDDLGEEFRLSAQVQPSIKAIRVCQFMHTALEELIDALENAPERAVSSLDVLPAAERHQMLVEWNDTGADYRRDKCIHELVAQQVAKTPEAIALVFEDEQLTYAELDCRANQLAHYLQRLGVGPEVVVGLCAERSLEMVVGLLGILKAGGAYLPLDPSYPKERLSYMLKEAQAPVLVMQTALIGQLFQSDAQLVRLDEDREKIRQQPTTVPQNGVGPDNLAYVIFTSGSTGRPKGVLLQHGGLCNLAKAQVAGFQVQGESRILQFASLSFDAAIWEIVMALGAGARLCLARREALLPGADLAQKLIEGEVSIVTLPPSALPSLDEYDFSSLKTVIIAGEACSVELANVWAARHQLVNAYGPTETTVCATFAQHEANSSRLLIGRPIANTRVYVLDGELKPVPVWVAGELFVAGQSLARGYLNQGGLTAERFIPSPFGDGERLYRTGDLVRYVADGNLEFLGRVDQQMKIRGFRVEPGEVEAALAQHPSVAQAAVIVREDRPGQKQLVAYVVLDREGSLERDAEQISERQKIDKECQSNVVPIDSAEAPECSSVALTDLYVPASTTRSLAAYANNPANFDQFSDLRRYAAEQLPDYMVPAAIVLLGALPLTPNGKLDRKALPAPDFSGNAYRAPRTPQEYTLVELYAEVLGLPQVGIDDNFFELGGHSLLATRLISRIRSTLNIELPIRALFEAPTVVGLALHLIDHTFQTAAAIPVLLPIRAKGTRSPLFCIHPGGGLSWNYFDLVQYLDDRPIYGLQARGLDGTAPLAPTLEAMVSDYIDEMRTVQPTGPYHLLGWSFGGTVAQAIAAQFDRQGEAVALLALLDARPCDPQDARESQAINEQILEKELHTYLISRFGETSAIGESQLNAILNVQKNNSRILGESCSPTYQGNALLFRATESLDASTPILSARAWEPYVLGEIEVRDIHCRHVDMDRPEPTAEIGHILAHKLKVIDSMSVRGQNHPPIRG
jgi:amino acid adenylation domain-containing protein